MEKKECTKCNKVKPLEFFSKQKRGRGGKASVCKECASIRFKEYYRKRYSSDETYKKAKVEGAKKWAKDNPEKRAKIAKQRNKRELNKNPEKVKARALINQRARFKRIPKASDLNCVKCGGPAHEYHHHLGYTWEHRYDVIPICRTCHRLADKKPT